MEQAISARHGNFGDTPTGPPPQRGVFCNRTLNLRAIGAIGYDMDYTIVQYRAHEWEAKAYQHLKRRLTQLDWPVRELRYNHEGVIRGLFIDSELGNLVKANRFGYVKRASHGTRMLDVSEHKSAYSGTLVDLSDRRYSFINALFALSAAHMYSQLVDILDSGGLSGVLGYRELWAVVRRELDEAHMEGHLKAEVMSDPSRFVKLDPELPMTLVDQRLAGKKLLLITNSDWHYTCSMMSYVLDRYMRPGETWRDLFDLIFVSAGKPDFFATRTPAFRLVDDDGLLELVEGRELSDKAYVAGNARIIEEHLGLEGSDILFVGDHLYSDVNVSKNVRRWRTALVLPELEDELTALAGFRAEQTRLNDLMEQKEGLEAQQVGMRMRLQRIYAGYDQRADDTTSLQSELTSLRNATARLDEEIAPLARTAAEIHNPRWGPLMRTGRDKSHLARQVERHADIYMSRVSNLSHETPFAYLRSPKGSLPHDPGYTPDPWADG